MAALIASLEAGVWARIVAAARTPLSDALEDFVGICYAPHLRHLATRWRDETRSQQGLGALLKITQEKEVRVRRKADVHRAMGADR